MSPLPLLWEQTHDGGMTKGFRRWKTWREGMEEVEGAEGDVYRIVEEREVEVCGRDANLSCRPKGSSRLIGN